MKLKIFITLLVAFLIVAVGLFYYFGPYQMHTYSIRTESVNLSEQWVEIFPNRPITCNQEIHELVIIIASPASISYAPTSLMLQDGTHVEIDAELVGSDGTVYPFQTWSYSDAPLRVNMSERGIGYSQLRRRTYKTVRLRSSRPVVSSEIEFNCWRPPTE